MSLRRVGQSTKEDKFREGHSITLTEAVCKYLERIIQLPSIIRYADNKSQRDALFHKFILLKNSTCFGQIYCPSSGVSTLYISYYMLVYLLHCYMFRPNCTAITNS